ncbi:hypothetical protein [Shewanella subflava]|uniref:Uncharacterized protein n=1 Tax=Shewanella subflava TaxID=2986476 RepID=A0ABT3I993_9GAMM|nr:hypothetical protein [Shewanella subflava]MCW3172631.1 hypothetical protein [Shewanella subflava]
MKFFYLALLMLFSAHATAHSHSPTGFKHHYVYKDVNTYSFTVENDSRYAAGFKVYTYDYDRKTNKQTNEKYIGTIPPIKAHENVSFLIDFTVLPSTHIVKTMCTVLDLDVPFKTKVCSVIEMERR